MRRTLVAAVASVVLAVAMVAPAAAWSPGNCTVPSDAIRAAAAWQGAQTGKAAGYWLIRWGFCL